MRKLLLSSLAATTMVGSALAADLRPPPPYVPPAPVATWTGLYIGINGGGIWTNSRDFVTTGTDFGSARLCAPTWSTAAALAATNVITINNRAQGLIGGTWGYNWQWGSFVVGTESDFDGVFGCRNDNNGNFGFFGGNNNNTCGGTAIGLAPVGPPAPAGFSVLNQQTVQRSLDWLWTSRVRAGFLVTPSFLIYGTGGVALGRVRVNSAIISSASPYLALRASRWQGISVLNDSRLKAGFAGWRRHRVAARQLRPIQFAVLQRFVLQGRGALLRSGTQQSRPNRSTELQGADRQRRLPCRRLPGYATRAFTPLGATTA